MIMLLTHRSEIRERLNESLQAKGHQTCVPAHCADVTAAMNDCQADVIVLDLYLAEPSGAEVVRRFAKMATRGESSCFPAWR